jgi:hypothetical protein
MQQIVTNDRVRLIEPLPELELDARAIGRVVSAWFHPNTAYEVEFPPAPHSCPRRILLLPDQVALA